MESLVASLMDSLLHPAVLVATAAATFLLFSGTVGRTLEFLESCRLPSLPARGRQPRADVAAAPARFSETRDALLRGTWQPPQVAGPAVVCSRTRMGTEPDSRAMCGQAGQRRDVAGPAAPARRRHRGTLSARHVRDRHLAGALVTTRSTPDPIGRSVAMPRGSTVGS